MIGLLIIRFVKPELLHMSFFDTRLGLFILGVFFVYLTFSEFKAVKNKEEWAANRFMGAIRVPLYLLATIFIFYLAAN